MKGATWVGEQGKVRQDVSIHAPNEGSDQADRVKNIRVKLFQSTLPMKGATR